MELSTGKTLKTSTINTDGLLNGRRCGTSVLGENLEDDQQPWSAQRQTLWNPVLGENLEDLSLQHDHEEREYRRDLLHMTLLSPVPGRGREDLHEHLLHDPEPECRRYLLQKPLLSPVPGRGLEDLHEHLLHDPEPDNQ